LAHTSIKWDVIIFTPSVHLSIVSIK